MADVVSNDKDTSRNRQASTVQNAYPGKMRKRSHAPHVFRGSMSSPSAVYVISELLYKAISIYIDCLIHLHLVCIWPS